MQEQKLSKRVELENVRNMKNINPGNGLKDGGSRQLSNGRDELIIENLDVENIFSLIRINNSDSIAILEKVKAITSIMFEKQKYEYMRDKCLLRSNAGKKVKVGSAVFQEFRVTSISTESYNSIRYAILAKFFPRYGFLKDEPGTINSFSLKKARLRPNCWENNAEINILGNFGKEYYVKINFFTYN
jgi:hypothetical protein